MNYDSGNTSLFFGDERVSTVRPSLSSVCLSFPEVSLPEVSLPEVSLPEVSLPEVSLPEVSLPEVSPCACVPLSLALCLLQDLILDKSSHASGPTAVVKCLAPASPVQPKFLIGFKLNNDPTKFLPGYFEFTFSGGELDSLSVGEKDDVVANFMIHFLDGKDS
jgi:hypothetical protein